jgi:FkbM family methyltransferase
MMIKRFVRSFCSAPTWEALSHLRLVVERNARNYRDAFCGLGGPAAASLMISWPRSAGTSNYPRLCRLRIKGYTLPLYYRRHTSDSAVIRQVFARREYECIANEKDVYLIIDCGANIGCASFFFLHQYPKAHVIAVEPDPGNFAVCRRNLAPFSDRVTLVNSGVWSTTTPLRVQRQGFRAGEWSFQVRPIAEGEAPDFMSTTVDMLLDGTRHAQADIVKFDIEAAEREVFSEGTERWLGRTKNLVIELHDEDCERVFFQAMSSYQYKLVRSGELTICRDIHPVCQAANSFQPAVPSENGLHTAR